MESLVFLPLFWQENLIGHGSYLACDLKQTLPFGKEMN